MYRAGLISARRTYKNLLKTQEIGYNKLSNKEVIEAVMVDIPVGSNILNQLRPTNFSTTRVANQTGTVIPVENQTLNVQNIQRNNRVQTAGPNDQGRAEAQTSRQAAQDRQQQLIETREASQAQQATTAEAGRERAALKDRSEAVRILQETRSLDTEQLQRNLQATTELARYDRERQDAITEAIRSSEVQPRGSIIDILG